MEERVSENLKAWQNKRVRILFKEEHPRYHTRLFEGTLNYFDEKPLEPGQYWGILDFGMSITFEAENVAEAWLVP